MSGRRKCIAGLLSLFAVILLCAQSIAASDFVLEENEEDIYFAPEGIRILSLDQLPEIPERAGCRGHVERVLYHHDTGEEESVEKAVYVYLPYGYEECDAHYNVIYLLHGSQSDPTCYLDIGEVTGFQNMLDSMIEKNVIAPVIVAMPTYYEEPETEGMLSLWEQVRIVQSFPEELAAEIIPAVEGIYRTYASAIDEESLISSRDHRAVGGFSLGGVATWCVLLREMKLFRYYMPYSEISWDDGKGGINGVYNSFLSAEVLHQAVVEQGYSANDLVLFAATGTRDSAWLPMTLQMEALAFYKDIFHYGENTFYFIVVGGRHRLKDAEKYMILGLRVIFAY